ncbi:MAG: TlpA disulfide reductase family protein [Proteobacteria bacterium]|nr:TlpA disulfide reductase family protein [Pseudomonadota bacterium]
MFKNMRKLIYTILILIYCHSVFSEASDPLFEDLDGQKHSLNDYIGKGKWVVVNVWATACPYCRTELDTLIDFHDQHHDKDAIVIGLTLDWPTFNFPDKEALKNFALDYFIEYPLFMVDAELGSKVIGKPVNMIPLTFFYNPDGDLVLRLNGVVTDKQLETAIKDDRIRYHVEWAEEVPPEFKPE